jgi:hypothetical protein
MAKAKDPAAVSLGRKGGLKKVKKGAAMLSPEEMKERAKAMAQARWGTKKKKAKKKAA